MKTIFIVLGVVIVGVGAWFAIQTKPDTSLPEANVTDVSTVNNTDDKKANELAGKKIVTKSEVDNVNVKIAFRGFGPGKVHNGSFGKVDSKLTLVGGDLQGEVSVDMNSLTTDTEALTKHLKTDAFFDTAKYSIATFKVIKLEGQDAIGGIASGIFTIKGKSKEITFPFTIIKGNNGTTIDGYTAKFNINMKEFGINQTFANEVIELSVTVPFK